MEKAKKIISIIILIILAPILFVNVVILIDSYVNPDQIPSFFGWKPFIVLSSSMETEIYPGDLVIVKEAKVDEIKEGDIIAFKQQDIVVTHRVVKILRDDNTINYITKGDNNTEEDEGYVLSEQIEGVYKFKIRRLGNLEMFIQTPIGIIVSLLIPILLLLLVQISYNIDIKKYINEKHENENELKEEIKDLQKQNEKLRNK